jgi:Sulfotransferase domain
VTVSRVIALWAVPRSVSTAFEQMMRARGDFHVLSEPFAVYFYYGANRTTSRRYYYTADSKVRKGEARAPLHDSDWTDVLTIIREAARSTPVFFKDMAYHLHSCNNPDFLIRFTNTFIIRHPRFALPSLIKLQPDTTFEEAGYYDQHRLMMYLTELTGEPPIVIDGQELRQAPERVVSKFCARVGVRYIPEALKWPPKLQMGWDPYWVKDAAASTGFWNREKYDTQLVKSPEIRTMYDACLELYEDMARRGGLMQGNA